tara:strand:- start:780 stop:1424 length:645 start_codon:yes stop_codon:yes gene_type:complete
MNLWESRWQEDRIGFHLPEVNPYLMRFSDQLLHQNPDRVFVPLCGKTLDLCWLTTKTKKVIGVELVSKAVQDFFAENNIDYLLQQDETLQKFSSKSIDIYLGDFFDLNPEQTSSFKAIYDRASIVAIEKLERRKYVDHLISFLDPAGRILLITLEYNQNQMEGPPYSVPAEEIESLFAPLGSLKLLETCDILDDRFRNKGLTRLLEHVFLIVKN